MNITVDIQVATKSDDSPEPEPIHSWIQSALEHPSVVSLLPQQCVTLEKNIELSLRIVDRDESQNLNQQYRGKNKPTNILSFPSDLPEGLPFLHLGDLVVCAPVVKQESIDQQKKLQNHWAHMLIHGTLHLVGFDHVEDAQAEIMETLEIDILSTMNIPNPYQYDDQKLQNTSGAQ
ncbi:MAG: rRNA maturation RNase YbeY [Cellvibrionaceae bacterium]